MAELVTLGGDLNIAMIHHPLEWLSPLEGSNIAAMLETSVQLLLRGHLHETRVESVASAEGQMLRFAAGAAYQSRKWPNRALYVRVESDRVRVHPIRYEDVPREVWTTDPSVFPDDRNHEGTFAIPGKSQVNAHDLVRQFHKSHSAPRFRSNVPGRGNRPFVGREDLIAEITRIFVDTARERVIVLHGQPGVGKSELAREFARLNRDRYRGGIFLVDGSRGAIGISLANIGKVILGIDLRSDLSIDEQGQETFFALAVEPVLLIYDNLDSFVRISRWLPPSGMPCHVLVTTLVDCANPEWGSIEVKPLSGDESLELVEKLAGEDVAARYGQTIAEHAGGLPVQIVPAATTLAYEDRRGRHPDRMSLAREAGDSFRSAYERLEPASRRLLHVAAFLNPQRIPMGELSEHLRVGLGWSEVEIGRTLDACLDLHLLDSNPEPSMHQLFAFFLRETLPHQSALEQVSPVQAKRFVQLAEAVAANPADSQTAALFISYPLAPPVWASIGRTLSIRQGVEEDAR